MMMMMMMIRSSNVNALWLVSIFAYSPFPLRDSKAIIHKLTTERNETAVIRNQKGWVITHSSSSLCHHPLLCEANGKAHKPHRTAFCHPIFFFEVASSESTVVI
jgi:hypothetical protein